MGLSACRVGTGLNEEGPAPLGPRPRGGREVGRENWLGQTEMALSAVSPVMRKMTGTMSLSLCCGWEPGGCAQRSAFVSLFLFFLLSSQKIIKIKPTHAQ